MAYYDRVYSNRIPDITERYPEGMDGIDMCAPRDPEYEFWKTVDEAEKQEQIEWEVASCEYTVEIYTENGDHERQVDVLDTYEEAMSYTENNPLHDGRYYSIWCIDYDKDGEEIDSYPVY